MPTQLTLLLLGVASPLTGGASSEPSDSLAPLVTVEAASEPLFVPLLAPPPQAQGRTGAVPTSNLRVSFEAGPRRYNSSWSGADDHSAFGFTGAQEPPGYLVGWDAGIFWSNDSGLVGGRDLKLQTWELYGGVMKTLHLIPHRLQFELGAGVAWNYLYAHNRNTISTHYEYDSYFSGYGRAGLNGLHLADLTHGVGQCENHRIGRHGTYHFAGDDI